MRLRVFLAFTAPPSRRGNGLRRLFVVRSGGWRSIGHEQDHHFVAWHLGQAHRYLGVVERPQISTRRGRVVAVKKVRPCVQRVLKPAGIGRKRRGDGVVADVRVDNGYEAVGSGIVRDELAGSLLDPFLILGGLRAEHEDDMLLLGNARHGRADVRLESGDGLLFAIFEEVEIGRGQAVDGFAFLAGYHHIHQHRLRLGFRLHAGRGLAAGSAGLSQQRGTEHQQHGRGHRAAGILQHLRNSHGISTVSLAVAICWPSASRATTRIM